MLVIVQAGCMSPEGTEGHSDSNAQVLSSVQAVPLVYDFGIVTIGNTPVPLEAKIQNNGPSIIKISNFTLSDTENFTLDLNRGSNPCSSMSPTIGAGDNCTVEIHFNPQFSALFDANLQIISNDSSNSTVNIQLRGSCEPITSMHVQINQVESDMQCPAARITAYVSVIDQGGYAVVGLLENNFAVYENVNLVNLFDFSFVSLVTAPISIALVMDYSGSITSNPEVVSDMEDAAVYFVEQLEGDDEAEIIKFATEVEIAQEFTSAKNLLTEAIYNPADNGHDTSLYDAAWQAIDDTASRFKERKAVIVFTDGEDTSSNRSLGDVIVHANDQNIPIFAIGLGDIDHNALQQMANDTGGVFFESGTSDNLRNIYAQLADVIFKNQYVLEFPSSMEVGETADLKIEASISQTVTDDDLSKITPCP